MKPGPADRGLSFSRLTLFFAVVAATGWIVVSIWGVVALANERTLGRAEQFGRSEISRTATLAESALRTEDDRVIRELLLRTALDPRIARVLVADQLGAILYSSDPMVLGNYLGDFPELDVLVARGRSLPDPVTSTWTVPGKHFVLVHAFALPARPGQPDRPGNGHVVMVMDLEAALGESLREVLSIALPSTGVLAIGLISLALVLLYVQRKLGELLRVTSSFRAGNFSLRAPAMAFTEFNALANSFNVMADDIESALSERSQSEQRFRRLFEASKQPMITLNRDAEALAANQAALELMGYPSTARLNAARLFGPCDAPEERRATPCKAIARMIERCTREGPHIFEWEYRLADDGRRHIESVMTPIEVNGQTVFHMAMRDISEQKINEQQVHIYREHLESMVEARTRELSARTEELTESREQLKQALTAAEAGSRAKSEFLANMSHEIRTPLNAIIGLTHLVQLENRDERSRERLGTVIRSARHLLNVVNDILDLSKIEAGRFDLDSTPFDVIRICEDAMEMISERARAKGLALETEFDGRLAELGLIGDPTRVGQVLINYLGNAVKFTEHGTITLRAKLSSRDAAQAVIRFEVEDTGIGIAERDQRRIFRAFEQESTGTTRGHGGTGLGLAISQRIARLMSGETGVQSEPGKGSTFWFTMCAKTGAVARAEPAPRVRAGDIATAAILLAEDDPINQTVAVELLSDRVATIDVAANGSQAVAMFERGTYDLVLMDIRMPELDGLEATRRIRNLPSGRQVPIIALTADAVEESRDSSLAAGMNDFLTKPITPESLYEKVALWLNREHEAGNPAPGLEPRPPANDDSTHVLDQVAGLRHFRGDRTSYEFMLGQFVDLHPDDAGRIRELLRDDRRDEAQRIAHSLKGLAGTLGATALQVCAARVDAAMKSRAAPEELDGLLSRLDETLLYVRTAITQLIGNPAADSPDKGPVADEDIGRFREGICQLGWLLYQDDIEASVVWDAIKDTVVGTLDDETLLLLNRYVHEYEFERAYRLLNDIVEDHIDVLGIRDG